MNANDNEAELQRNAAAIAIWENEGGSLGHDSLVHQLGRRIERDGSWTVYHVFTGVPAHTGGRTMIGLSWLDATEAMLSLNRRNDGRRDGRISLPTTVRNVSE